MLDHEILKENLNDEYPLVRFIKVFGYSDDEYLFLQYFDDRKHDSGGKKEKIQIRKINDKYITGMRAMNDGDGYQDGRRYAVCWRVNGDSEDAKKVNHARAQFMECDYLKEDGSPDFERQIDMLNQFKYEPSIIIKTRKSLHCYWLMKDGDIKQFMRVQKKLCYHFNGDIQLANGNRENFAMRLPGFYHQKSDPVMVKIIKCDPELQYTQQQLDEALEDIPEGWPLKKKTKDSNPKTHTTDGMIKAGNGRRREYVKSRAGELVARFGDSASVDQILRYLAVDYFQNCEHDPGETIEDFITVIDHIRLVEYAINKHEENGTEEDDPEFRKYARKAWIKENPGENFDECLKERGSEFWSEVFEVGHRAKAEGKIFDDETADEESIVLRSFHRWDKTGKPKGVHDWNVFRYICDTENIFVMGGVPYIYDHGVYIPDTSSTKLKTLIRGMMYDDFKTAPNIKKIYDLFLSDAGLYTESKDLYNFPDEWINFRNAFYDPIEKRLIPHDPKFKAINQIPFPFDPEDDPGDKEVDRWLQFIAPDDEDREMFLQFLGYCLTGDIAQQKMLFLKGIEGTGKSTVIKIMTAMVGEDNTSNVPMQRLASDRFAAARLVGKTLNTCGDLGIKPIDDVAFMKNCLGDDGLEAEMKGKDSYSFKNRAKIIYSANELPIIKNERTKGFYRKILILKMDTPPEKRDMYYEQRLKKGIPHLVHLAVDALSRMYHSGRIMESKNSIEAVNEWWTDSDPVEAWLQAETERDPEGCIKREELFKSYEKYCDDMGIKEKCSNKGLFRALRNKGFHDARITKGRDKGGFAFYGISFKLLEAENIPDIPFH